MINTCSLVLLLMVAACKDSASDPDPTPDNPPGEVVLSEQNLERAMELTDNAIASHFTGEGMAMARYYNPYTGVRSDEKGS
ncbi:MAG: hydrolase, partial [Bacteroidota bacterium]|nr:hydrolase [Bacteroidota bacterium]